MWKASAGHQINQGPQTEDDDWDTDPNFINDVTEEEQRWGSKTIEGSGRTGGAIDMQKLREETENADATKKKKEIEDANTGYGYGGKFGVEKDRMDKSAMGHDYIGKVDKHASQKDYSDGFGGKFGVQTDRVDKSAVNWDYKEKVVKHSSQKDYSDGFGGKYGVQTDRVDKSALGWDHVEKVNKHESQKDYSVGFGGKFGVQEDRKDKSALGWDHVEAPQKHESQTEYKKGFGGQFGVMSDRMDKSAIGFQEQPDRVGTNYTKVKPDIGGAKPSNLRAKFENMAKFTEDDTQQRAAEQKRIREERDQKERDEALKKQSQVNTEEPKLSNQRRGPIDTGRQGGIGNAITAFNQVQSPTEAAPERKEPIKLPKQVVTKAIPVQPDIIPTVEPPVVEPIDEPIEEPIEAPKEIQPAVEPTKRLSISEDRHSNQQVITDNTEIEIQKTVEPILKKAAPEDIKKIPDTENTEQIYQNQEDISEYIEDTGLVAIALYDYQAAAEDELSFDPDDVITHIEMIDEGWWRGLSKNRYGLFPANYVQLVQQ